MVGRNTKIKTSLNKAKELAFSAVTGIVLSISIALVGFRLFGYNIYTVMSGSMEPALNVGSIIFVQPATSDDLKEGDIISFVTAGNTVVTHRIKEIVTEYENHQEKVQYISKGDANNSIDGGFVDPRNVVGKVVFSIPLLGFPVYSIQQPPAIYFVSFFAMLLLVSVFVPSVEKKGGRELLTN